MLETDCNLLEEISERRQIPDELLRFGTDSMPYWIELSSDDDVKSPENSMLNGKIVGLNLWCSRNQVRTGVSVSNHGKVSFAED